MKRFDDTAFSEGDPSFNWDNEEGQDGMMETFGDHWIRVRQQCEKKPLSVWSIVEKEDGLYITPEYSESPDVFLYFISLKERNQGDQEEYIWHLNSDMDN